MTLVSYPSSFLLTTMARYAFNAWIPLISYNTNYAPRFLVGNSVTVGLIVCAASTLACAVRLERRDKEKNVLRQEEEEDSSQEGRVHIV
jgi:ACS family pantothenate transporter-like MFS transporter